ncbi:hypothetical protein OUZ56_024597 [Daphnia magna]|uniref:Uncharacterized protein n=1 Tax=Daphnia magna TaxID=35525 RepID=A0ABR0B113_9CRUS|nr:hypothetical protein OUZ56_024597 [Daphnia magna]
MAKRLPSKQEITSSSRWDILVSLGHIGKFMEDTDIVSKLNYINGRMAKMAKRLPSKQEITNSSLVGTS